MKISQDHQFLTQIVNQFGDMILRIAHNHLYSVDDSEDIRQNVFIKLMKQKEFDNLEHLKAWLIRVTINECINHTKKREKESYYQDISTFADQPKDQTLMLLEKLNQTERNVIYLFYYEGYSAQEIGDLIGKKEGAIFTILSRARQHLKQLLED